MYFVYNSANTQCITTLTTGVMFIKHLPHSCVSLNVIRKMQMNLDGIFQFGCTCDPWSQIKCIHVQCRVSTHYFLKNEALATFAQQLCRISDMRNRRAVCKKTRATNPSSSERCYPPTPHPSPPLPPPPPVPPPVPPPHPPPLI